MFYSVSYWSTTLETSCITNPQQIEIIIRPILYIALHSVIFSIPWELSTGVKKTIIIIVVVVVIIIIMIIIIIINRFV